MQQALLAKTRNARSYNDIEITVYFSQELTSMDESPLVSFTLLPALMASGIFSTVANMISNPTAVRTLPSIVNDHYNVTTIFQAFTR